MVLAPLPSWSKFGVRPPREFPHPGQGPSTVAGGAAGLWPKLRSTPHAQRGTGDRPIQPAAPVYTAWALTIWLLPRQHASVDVGWFPFTGLCYSAGYGNVLRRGTVPLPSWVPVIETWSPLLRPLRQAELLLSSFRLCPAVSTHTLPVILSAHTFPASASLQSLLWGFPKIWIRVPETSLPALTPLSPIQVQKTLGPQEGAPKNPGPLFGIFLHLPAAYCPTGHLPRLSTASVSEAIPVSCCAVPLQSGALCLLLGVWGHQHRLREWGSAPPGGGFCCGCLRTLWASTYTTG